MSVRPHANGVSVLLPVYWDVVSADRIALLRRALESIHDQAYPDGYEILLVDDGSTVPLEELQPLIGRSSLDHCRILRCHRNNGVSHALNLGLASARHPFIARLDADDWWRPAKIAAQMQAFESDPDLSICATGMSVFFEREGRHEDHIRSRAWNDIITFAADVGCPFPHGSILARADVFRLVGGYTHDKRFDHCEDYALWGVWLRFFKPSMIEQLLLNYSITRNSVSTRHQAQQTAAADLVAKALRRIVGIVDVTLVLPALAEAIGLSVLEAGKLAYRMWRFGAGTRLSTEAAGLVQRLMPDRRLREARGIAPVASITAVEDDSGPRGTAVFVAEP